jgi:glycosyltransferase involved in cell wall biosynthesis
VRVAVDLTPAFVGTTGVARYAHELTSALRGEGIDVAGWAVGRTERPVTAGVTHIRVPLRVVQRSWRLLGRPRAETLVSGADLVHSLDLVPPPTRLPLVATVHDLVALEHPDLHPRRAVEQQRQRLANLDDVDAVLADSKATADALVRHGIDAALISVVPLGLTALPGPGTPLVREPFLLAVGSVAPRKGLDVLIQAFAAADAPGVVLAIAGPPERESASLDALARRVGVQDRLQWLGQVDDVALATLYRDAVALCFPSRAEGFGLPVLEAMGAGLPVVASDLDVIRELTGDAAVLVSPDDVDALRVGLERVVNDADLRQRLQRAGKERATVFTWAATARATVTAYHAAMHRRR